MSLQSAPSHTTATPRGTQHPAVSSASGHAPPAAHPRYATGHLTTHNVTSTRRAIHAQLTRFRQADRPIIHVLHDSPAGAPIFTPGTPLALEFEELTPEDGEAVVRKEHPGSFTDTPLADILASLAVSPESHRCAQLYRSPAKRGARVRDTIKRGGADPRPAATSPHWCSWGTWPTCA